MTGSAFECKIYLINNESHRKKNKKKHVSSCLCLSLTYNENTYGNILGVAAKIIWVLKPDFANWKSLQA